MNGFAALLYADWRKLVNDGRRAVRAPGRIALWALYVVGIGLFWFARTVTHGRHHRSSAFRPDDVSSADFFVCSLLIGLALVFAIGRGAFGIFGSRVEARFIIGSPISAPLAIAYLQTREVISRSPRFLFSLSYFIFVFSPGRLGPPAILADLLLVALIYAAFSAIIIPRRLLAGPGAVACSIGGGALAICAALPALRAAVVRFEPPLPAAVTSAILGTIPAWHPGRVFLEPSLGWVLAALALAACATAILAGAGSDSYPELYALSIAQIDRLERWRARRRGAAGAATAPAAAAQRVVAAGRWAPAGVPIYIWKSVVEFGRQRRPALIAGGYLAWCVAGFAAGNLFVRSDDAVFFAVAGTSINLILIFGVTATGAVASEVRRPMFWLADTPLYERLCALVVAQVWRPVATFEAVALGFAVGGGKPIELLFIAVGLPALVVLLAGAGFVAYALFPSAADWRGPVLALRVVLCMVFLIPPLVLFGIAAATLNVPIPALLGASLLAVFEGAVLVGVAAWRLDGHIDRLVV